MGGKPCAASATYVVEKRIPLHAGWGEVDAAKETRRAKCLASEHAMPDW